MSAAIKRPRLIMLGPDLSAKGGMASVANVYREGGLFERWGIRYISTFEEAGSVRKLWLAFCALLQVLRQLLLGRVAGLHIHTASRASFWRKSAFALLALTFRRPYVLHLHGGMMQEFYADQCGSSGRSWIRFILRHAAAVIVLSPQWADWLQQICPQAKVAVVPNPVQVGQLEAGRKEQGSVLFLGRLEQNKGIYELLDALAIVVRQFPQLRLLIGGDGEVDQVRAKAEQLGLGSNIELHGWVSGAQKQVLFSRASLLVLPSYKEGLPMAVLEAMAQGIPVVASKVGGVPYAIRDKVEGLLVPAGDRAALAEALLCLFADPALAQKMGAAGWVRARQLFSVPAVLQQVDALYTMMGVTCVETT